MNKIINSLEFTDDLKKQNNLILRDQLALVRTKLANERTLFSYIRTSLYLFTAGMGILEIKSIEHLKIIAYVSLIFSGLLFFTGLLKFFLLNRHLKSYTSKNTLSENRTE